MRTFFIKDTGNIKLQTQINFTERIKNRLHLHQVYTEEECDVIFAFCEVVSRAGTDIAATLQKIQTSKPVVLVVLHHTFDTDSIVPQSKRQVKVEGVFAVDFLFHEDQGLLRSLHNDKELKSVTDYLISLGATPNIMLNPTPRWRQYWKIVAYTVLGFVLVAAIVTVILNSLGILKPKL